MDLVVRRFDVFLIALDPTVGHEIKKTRPALVISPEKKSGLTDSNFVEEIRVNSSE